MEVCVSLLLPSILLYWLSHPENWTPGVLCKRLSWLASHKTATRLDLESEEGSTACLQR